MKFTQRERILDYMKEFGSISSLEAFRDLGITRLAARIHELERQGIEIKRTPESMLNRYNEKTSYTRYSVA